MFLIRFVKKFILGIYNTFKLFGLLLLRRKRILRVSKTTDAVILFRRLMAKGVLKPNALSKKLALQSEKDMIRTVRKANKKGKKLSVNDLVNFWKAEPELMKLCEELGMSMNFFKGLAENVLKERQGGPKG